MERRWAYSRAVMPVVTANTVKISNVAGEVLPQISHSPGLSRWGWVSCTGWPKESLAADTEVYERRWEDGTLLYTTRFAINGAIHKAIGLANLLLTRPHDCMLDYGYLEP